MTRRAHYQVPRKLVAWELADGTRLPPASLRQRVTEFYWRNPDGHADLRTDSPFADLPEVNEDGTPVESERAP